MDEPAVLRTFDEQLRRGSSAPFDGRLERDDRVVRYVSDSWSAVIWSGLGDDDADEVIADQVHRLGDRPGTFEWKYYSYDQPPDLPDRLLAAGFTREPDEALLIAEIAALDSGVRPPPGIEVRPVEDETGVEALVSVHDEVFGGDHTAVGQSVLAGLSRQPATVAAVVAWAGDTPVSAGRVEFHEGTEFASIWGGGTLPAWRGRGVFRALVAHRANAAAERGFRYLQVDASPDSTPILQRLGFVRLATTTPFVYPAPDASR